LEPEFLERATAIGWSSFLLGAAVVHIRQIRMGQPFVPGNAGAVFYSDIFVPIAVLGLLRVCGNRARIGMRG
jgi:hypothetical protein